MVWSIGMLNALLALDKCGFQGLSYHKCTYLSDDARTVSLPME